mgnify:CR=1 FL=1
MGTGGNVNVFVDPRKISIPSDDDIYRFFITNEVGFSSMIDNFTNFELDDVLKLIPGLKDALIEILAGYLSKNRWIFSMPYKELEDD